MGVRASPAFNRDDSLVVGRVTPLILLGFEQMLTGLLQELYRLNALPAVIVTIALKRVDDVFETDAHVMDVVVAAPLSAHRLRHLRLCGRSEGCPGAEHRER